MKQYKLDKEERQILKDYEAGEFRTVKNAKKKIAEHIRIARATLKKSKSINIRISERDLHALKVKAMEKGLPYQTLVSSVLHQYSHDRMVEK